MRSSTFSRALVQDSFRYSFCKDADQALLAPAKHSIFARGLASGFLPLEYPFFMFYLGLPRTRSTQTICLMQISWLSFFPFFFCPPLFRPFSSLFCPLPLFFNFSSTETRSFEPHTEAEFPAACNIYSFLGMSMRGKSINTAMDILAFALTHFSRTNFRKLMCANLCFQHDQSDFSKLVSVFLSFTNPDVHTARDITLLRD